MKRGREITTIPIIVADVHDRDKSLKTNDYNVKNIVLTVMNDSNFIIEKIRSKLTIIFNKKAYPLLTFDEIPFLNPKEIIDQHIGKEIIDFFNVEKYLETSHFLQKKTKDKWKTIPYEGDKQVNGWMPADVVHPKTRKIGPIETGSLKFELILDLQFKSLYSDRVHHLKDMFSFEWVYSLQDGNPESRIIKSSKRFGWNLRRKDAL